MVEEESPRPAIRAASLLYLLTGLAGGLSNLAVLAYWQRYERIPQMLGIPLDYGGLLEAPGSIGRLAPVFIASASLDLLAARWLWQGRRRGGSLGMILVPANIVVGIVLALPFWLLIAPIRGVLISIGWKSLR